MTALPDLPVLSVDDLAVRFPVARTLADRLAGRPERAVHALGGVRLEVRRGETLGIVGESGCGKSTLARTLVGLIAPSEGRVRFHGRDIAALRGAERRAFNRRVQMIFQDPYGSLNPRMTVGQVLAEALSVHRMRPKAEVPGRIRELLDLVRLPADAADKLPHEFSGGQRQRIGIARALSVEPEIVVADELVSALDVSVQAQVVNLLLDLQQRLGLTLLFVAHDLRLVRHISHRVAVMYLGEIVEVGPTEALFSAPRHPYTRALLDAAPDLDPARRGQRARRVAEPHRAPLRLPLPPALRLGLRALPGRAPGSLGPRPPPCRGLPSCRFRQAGSASGTGLTQSRHRGGRDDELHPGLRDPGAHREEDAPRRTKARHSG